MFAPITCSPGEPAGASGLPDVLGSASGLQSLLRASGLRSWPGHHAHRRPCLLLGRSLERKTKVYLPFHWWVVPWQWWGHSNVWQLTQLIVLPAERATLLGQSLCFVVFPQLDPVETPTASDRTEPSSGRSSLCANS